MQQESVVRARNLPPDQAGEMVGFTRRASRMGVDEFCGNPVAAGAGIGATHQGRGNGSRIAGRTLHCELGCWANNAIGARANVFDGLPYAIYLPADNQATVKAETVCEIAECRVPSKAKLEPRLVTPKDVESSLRGGENASRQIVDVIPPSFPADKLVVVEVYTPGGNWSSYPPHKHDVDQPPVEVDLDEIYYYRMKNGRGFALQNLYRSDRSRESLVKVNDGDVVLVRDGYHPVVAGPGYDTYYLNFLAGTARTMTVTEDPEHVWLRSTWKQTDPRLPLVHG